MFEYGAVFKEYGPVYITIWGCVHRVRAGVHGVHGDVYGVRDDPQDDFILRCMTLYGFWSTERCLSFGVCGSGDCRVRDCVCVFGVRGWCSLWSTGAVFIVEYRMIHDDNN